MTNQTYDGEVFERTHMWERIDDWDKRGWDLVCVYPREPTRPDVLQAVFKRARRSEEVRTETMRDWCRGCGGTYAPDNVQWMAGIPYHPHCAQREMDFMDAADAHFRAQDALSIEERED